MNRPLFDIVLAGSFFLSAIPAFSESLFNGKDLTGWKVILKNDADHKETFTVQDGIIVCSGKPAGYLRTEKSYSNYTLSYQWRYQRPEGLAKEEDFKGNSGCLVHITKGPGIGFWPRCLEVQGMNRQAGFLMFLPGGLKGELTYDKEAYAKAIKPVGEWNTFEIEVEGGSLTTTLNGTKVSEAKNSELTEGPIGFQSEGAEIHFRNFVIEKK